MKQTRNTLTLSILILAALSCSDSYQAKPNKQWELTDHTSPSVNYVVHHQEPSKTNSIENCSKSPDNYTLEDGTKVETYLSLYFYTAVFVLNKDYTKLGFEKNNVNIHIRFPKISDQWHIFKLRPNLEEAQPLVNPGYCWTKNLWEEKTFVSMLGYHKTRFEHDEDRVAATYLPNTYHSLTIFIRRRHFNSIQGKNISGKEYFDEIVSEEDIHTALLDYSDFDLKYESPVDNKVVEFENHSISSNTSILTPSPETLTPMTFGQLKENIGTIMFVE